MSSFTHDWNTSVREKVDAISEIALTWNQYSELEASLFFVTGNILQVLSFAVILVALHSQSLFENLQLS